MNTQLKEVLRSKISLQDETLNDAQTMACYSAMTHYAALKVNEYKESERKSVNLEAIKLFPALFLGEWKLWLRKRAFLKAKKAAQIQADIENRPFYVIRSTEIAYVVQSTLEVRNLKRRRIYGRHATAIRLRETADATCYPTIGNGFDKVIQDWKNVDRSKLSEDKQVMYDKFKPVINSLLKSQFGIK